jgi:hypothetical protein
MIRFVNASAPAGHAGRFESPRANESDEALDAAVAALAGDEDAIESAAAGLHSFLDRVQSVENFHKIQFTALDTSGAVVMRRPGDG